MMVQSLRSLRETIALLSQVPHDERPGRVAVLEAQTLDQIAGIKSARHRSESGFDAYADALVIAELETRLEFLRGLKFDLVMTHSLATRV